MAFTDDLRDFVLAFQERIVERVSGLNRRASPPTERQWGLSPEQLAVLHDLHARDYAEMDIVDDRAWSDLELSKIFKRLDKAVTPLGAQHLYALLKHYESNRESLAANTKARQVFKSKPDAVERLRNALADLNRSATADLASFLLGPPPATPPRYRFFYILSVMSIVCPFGLFISPWFLPPTVGLWILNIVLHCHFGQGVLSHRRGLKSLAIMLGCVPKIARALHDVDLPEAKEIQTTIEAANSVRKQISRAFLRDFKGDDFFAAISEYLNLLCLFELCAFCRAFRLINQNRPTLIRIMRIVARLDAFQGLATALSDYPSICVPEFQSERGFTFTDVYHPLVKQPVSNTIQCSGRSIILSGTNMAGKTTFIKTLGLNVVLAQTIGFCLARKAIIPPARVKTLIERQDTIVTGQSYFYFEATELLRMFKDGERSDHELWFVLDEVFRGTNAVERVAAGAAVLNHLNQRGFVVASTHDQELTNLLRNEFDTYHFSEVIQGNEARFDYHLRKGPCTTRNAIKLLGLAGYPKAVTDLAKKITGSLT